MVAKDYQQAWFHGLPGYDMPGGVPVEVVDFTPPQPARPNLLRRFTNWLFVLLGLGRRASAERVPLTVTASIAPDLEDTLQKLVASKAVVPQLSLVVRTDPESEEESVYEMAGATITSVAHTQADGLSRMVNIVADRIGTRAGSNLNPGPPANAPEVRDAGGNMGWIFGIADNQPSGLPVDVEDFRPPNFDGRLTVTFVQCPGEVERLLRRTQPVRELVLVLPDRARRSYVEFKLWNARVSQVNEPGAPRVAFESNLIAWLTG